MKLAVKPLACVAAVLAGGVLLAGCAGAPTRYYTLAESAPAPAAATAATSDSIYIDLPVVSVPDRLARPQFVVRRAGAPAPQMDVLEQRRWTSSFENEIRDALASGVAARLGAIDASRGGRPPGQPVYRISVQVQQFEATEGTGIQAAFSWTLRRADEAAQGACQLVLTEPATPDVDALAQGAQRVTAKLAGAIAASVSAMRAGRTAVCSA
jgi:uncharacterized lipoprotein YmbA